MASLEARGDSYRVYWRLGGRRDGRKQSCTFPTFPQAEAAQKLVESPSRRHNITSDEVYKVILGLDGIDPTAPTVDEWAKEWIAKRRKLGDIQADTVDGYERVIRLRVLPRMGHLRLPQVDDEVITQWVAWMNTQPARAGQTLSAATVRRAHSILHAMLGAAVPKWMPVNPCAKPVGSRGRKAGLPKAERFDAVFLTREEIRILQDACPEEISDMVYTAVRTGLRLGELLVLRVEDITLTGRRKLIRVRRALKPDGTIGPPKSRRSRRDVTIGADLALRLKPRTTNRRPSDLLFPAPGRRKKGGKHETGGMWHPSNLHHRYWVKALAEAQRCKEHPPQVVLKPEPPKPKPGEKRPNKKPGPARHLRPDEVSTCDCPTRLHRKLRWHDLRHTHVGLLIEDGWRETRIQRRVGHESISTTIDLYGHLWADGDEERLDSFERMLAFETDEVA